MGKSLLINKSKFFLLYSVIPLVCLFLSCSYSFKGANPPEGIKTIFIPTFTDNSGFGLPTLSEDMTLLLKNKIIKDNTL